MANAGLVAGSYTGVSADSSSGSMGEAGVNMPRSRAAGAGWALMHDPDVTVGTSTRFVGKYGNIFRFGSRTGVDDAPRLTAAEAWNVDTKMDDGRPATGIVRTFNSSYRPNCVSSTDPDTAEYLLPDETQGCNLFFITDF